LIELHAGADQMTPIEMTIEEQNEWNYRVRYEEWTYREPRDDSRDKIFLAKYSAVVV
jgi:hypothetical protein